MLVHLTAADVSVVLDASTPTPMVLHWGTPLGAVDPQSLRVALARPRPFGDLDQEVPLTLVPEHGLGWVGRPALLGRREDGGDWAPRFTPVGQQYTTKRLTTRAVDEHAGLVLETEVALDGAGVLVVTATLTNSGPSPYELHHLGITLPLPDHATELMGIHGRWLREMQPHRVAFTGGHTSESRRGRTSHDRPPLVYAGEAGFSEQQGEVWGVHLAWSG
ncbi:MAG TPA: glycoside hydrolase family 36 N-terminal domain-containing protein, partial [Acidimicrobiales bacterium]